MPELSAGANLAWQFAAGEAANKRSEFIEKEYIFMGILSLEKVFAAEEIKEEIGLQIKQLEREYFALEDVIKGLALDMTKMRRAVRDELPEGDYTYKEKVIHRSQECKDYFQRAGELGKGEINSLFLLAAILEKPGRIIESVLKEFNLEPDTLKEKLIEKADLSTHEPMRNKGGKQKEGKPKKDELIWLNRFGRDLVKEAKEGKLMPIEGRRDEMLQMVRTLSRKTKNNPVLIGEAGVGKTAIVEGLAQRIVAKKNLVGKKIIELSIASLVGGTKYRGEFEERLNRVIEEAKQHPEVILFLDEIHNLVGTGRVEGSMDAANILKPALARGDISCIGATTIAEYRKYIEKDSALERRFQPIMVNEPTPEETIRILLRLKPKFEEHHKVTITEEAIVKAVELSVRYLPYRQLPDKAVDIIDEACASVQVPKLSMVQGVEQREVEKGNGGDLVDEERVAEVVSRITGIPVSKLTEKDVDKFLNLEKYLKERIRGQDEAVKTIASKLRLAKTGMRDKNRSLSVFLFLGPTGVGKTLFAKTIADVLFGSEREMIRLDMSEYQEKHTVSKLIGAPPGYIGYEEEGQLTGKLRNKPYSVVLLDEIEKAHPEVLDIFLQLFDEGRLTDSKGRTIDGRNVIFIMTSNLPSENRMGFKVGATSIEEKQTLATVRKSFRPEFLNRIDKIIIFKHLTTDIIKEIVKQQLDIFYRQMSKEYGISLSFSEEILDLIAEAGYSERNGAREIQRTIEQLIKEPLSEDILRFQSKGVEIKGSIVKIERQNEAIRIIWGSKGTTPPTRPPDRDIDE